MQITKQIRAAIMSTALLAACGVLRANPSNQDVDAALAVHGLAMSPELQQRAQALYVSAMETLASCAKAGNASRWDGKRIGQAHLSALRIERLAERLRLLGEPAGVDYEYRAKAIRQSLGAIVNTFKSAPTSQRFIESIRLQIRKQDPIRKKTLVKVQELARQQNWEQAENTLYELLDLLETGTVFLTGGERSDIHRPFNDVQQAVDQAMFRARYAQAIEALQQSRRTQTPDFAGVASQMAAAAQALATSAQVPWGDAVLTGPQLVEQFGQKWRDVQVAALRCRALDWAIYDRKPGDFDTTAPVKRDVQETGIDVQMGQFKAAVAQAMAQAITAESQRGSQGDVARLYREYLNVLAPLVRQSELRGLAVILEPPLENLAAKSDVFAQEINAYRAATDELLRWRGRVAAGPAAAHASEYPSVEKPFLEATRSGGGQYGLFPASQADPRVPALQGAAPGVMSLATERLVGQKVAVHDAIRLPGQSRAAIARYRLRTYVNMPANLNVQDELDALKTDLMISDQATPLTLAATQSLISAERGDFVLVGGTISGLHLESLITRFATLPPAAAVLIPLGVMPPEDVDRRALAQMMMRFDLQPTWVQHDHFFVAFTPPAQAASSQ